MHEEWYCGITVLFIILHELLYFCHLLETINLKNFITTTSGPFYKRFCKPKVVIKTYYKKERMYYLYTKL
jgi:hypothetical protein